MATPNHPPKTADEMRAAILDNFEDLSKRLQQIARYVLDEPNAVALETLAVIAERSGVQPSAIVRFAKYFGFEGATQMQRLFRDGLLSGAASVGYGERVRQFTQSVNGRAAGGPAEILEEFVEGNTIALANISETIGRKEIAAAVRLLSKADVVYVAGFRRSFPVASYLAYSLHQVDKKTIFIDGVGGLGRQQAHSMGKNDLLIAISYQPYAEEAIQLVGEAIGRGAKVLSISDSLVSPVAKPATLTLQVKETEIRRFRTLAASMCLAQTLVIAYAFDQTARPERRRSDAATK